MTRPSKSASLIDGDDQEIGFKINTKFAEKYQETKKKEELSVLEDRYKEKLAKKGVKLGKKGGEQDFEQLSSLSDTDSESDTVEDEDGELVTPAVEAQILRTLAEIRARDPKVYDPNVKFFSPEELKKVDTEWKSKKREEKPLRLKDFHRQKLLAEASQNAGGTEESEEDKEAPLVTHEEEQAGVLNEFLQAAKQVSESEAEDTDGLLKVRPKTEEELAREDVEYRNFLLENLATSENARENMSAWFNSAERGGNGVTTDEQFLIDYVLSRGWVEKDRKALPTYDQIVAEVEDDAAAVDAMEEFEEKYNFRFEQPGGTQITTYARSIEGSLRRSDTKRREERAARKSRKQEEKQRQQEELKRLKNLKKAEIQQKLRKIQEISGNSKVLETDIDLESDFDPDTHDQKMRSLFDKDYYEDGCDGEKPGWEDSGAENDQADSAVQSKIIKKAAKSVKKALKKTKAQAEAKAKEDVSQLASKYLDEYYKLDYEDMIDDIPCHFKYQEVAPTTFGLKPVDIFLADDTDLNAHVSLKKLAPYRPAERVKADEQIYGHKKRLYKFYDLLDRKLSGEGPSAKTSRPEKSKH